MTPTQRLNITNGDSAASTLSGAGVEGKIVAWRDVLHEGPVDSSLALESLSRKRARFIAQLGWDEFAHVSRSFAKRDRVIRHLDHFDEVVLWFEEDLYDQLQLIQLLDFFGRGAARGKRLSVIVVDGYISPLSAARVKELDTSRPRATSAQFGLAKRAWRAFGSADPTAISRLLSQNTSALPYLGRALARHLEEFPSSHNGLSRSERQALTAVEAGHSTPIAAFIEVGEKEESIFLGDTIFYSYLERLSGKTDALVTWKDGTPVIAPSSEKSREFARGELRVTPLGREVLAGKSDWQPINGRTRWLGGVEIKPGEGGWRWDLKKGQLVRGKAAASAKKAQPQPRPGRAAKRTILRRKRRTRPPIRKSKPRSPARRVARKQK